MPRPIEDRLGRSALDDAAEIHHRDAAAHRADDREVVADQDIGEVEGLAQAAEQRQHRRLHRHVETRRRLVQDDDLGMQGEDARQADAPLLAAGNLVRIEIEMRVGQPDRFQDAANALLARRLVEIGVDHQRLVQRAADLPARIERGPRILVGVLQAFTHGAPGGRRQLVDALPLEPDLARRRLVNAHDGLAERGLAATGFAHQPEDFARHQVERDAVDRLDRPDAPVERTAHGEVDLQVAQTQDRLRHGTSRCGW